eukprot:scaffold1560_cov146-Skeletonema_dohrnii-CCMP3373.AAC.2
MRMVQSCSSFSDARERKYFLRQLGQLQLSSWWQEKSARISASFVYLFEQWNSPVKVVNGAKHEELKYADKHTLVSFFRSRIPCKCLDEKYKEVKNITKMGICANLGCSKGKGGLVPRSTLSICTIVIIVLVNVRLMIGHPIRRSVPLLQKA